MSNLNLIDTSLNAINAAQAIVIVLNAALDNENLSINKVTTEDVLNHVWDLMNTAKTSINKLHEEIK